VLFLADRTYCADFRNCASELVSLFLRKEIRDGNLESISWHRSDATGGTNPAFTTSAKSNLE
jgi:hypothetical protein